MCKILIEPVVFTEGALELEPPEGYYFKQLVTVGEGSLCAVYQAKAVKTPVEVVGKSVDDMLFCVLSSRGIEMSYEKSLQFFREQLGREVEGLGGEFMTEEERKEWAEKHHKYCKGNCFA